MGAPTTYGPEIREKILKLLEEGKSLRKACQGEDMPTPAAVLKWCKTDKDFAERYDHARMVGYMLRADELLDIADDGTNDTYVDDEGRPRVDIDVIQRSRLRVDTRKWVLAKMLPKIYGDKVINEHTGTDGEPLTVRVVHEVVDPRSEGN